MRYLAVGLFMAVGLVGLVIDGASEDTYYGDGTSRWEHADRLGSQPIVVGAGILAALMTVWVLTRALPRSAPPAGIAVFFALFVYAFSWFIAWISMGVGH